MQRRLVAVALLSMLVSTQVGAALFTTEEEELIRSKTEQLQDARRPANSQPPKAAVARGAAQNPDAQAARLFSRQTKDNRFTVPKALSDKYCNPYFDKSTRLDAICTVVWLERPAADPVTYRIDRNAIDAAWQLVEAIDARAISEQNAAAALSRIIKSHDHAFEQYVGQRVQLEAARQSAPVVMPSMGDTAPAPTPSAPVRTRCERVPFSVTGEINCTTY